MLGELLVHEMQHVKLTALCDLFDLFDPADTTYVPGALAARSPAGRQACCNGTYAHLAVADLWRSRYQVKRQTGTPVSFSCEYRSWVERGIETLLNGDSPDAGTARASSRAWASTVKAWAGDG